MSLVRKQAPSKQDSKTVQDEIAVLPVVSQLPQHWQRYLAERRVHDRIKDALNAQKEKLKPYAEAVCNELRQLEKPRRLFHVAPPEEELFGSCAGLRVAKRMRVEQFNEKRLEEVTISSVIKAFEGSANFPPDFLTERGKAICVLMLKERERKTTYAVEHVKQKGAPKPKKRRKEEQE